MFTQNNEFLVDGPITPAMISEVIHSSNSLEIGAHSIFIGQVRKDIINGQSVTGIEYSAYPQMVMPEIKNIIESVSIKYADIRKIHILHSTGLVNVGEISLLVFVACEHRKESFRAMEEIVELIKERIPIWKKENMENSTHQWPSN